MTAAAVRSILAGAAAGHGIMSQLVDGHEIAVTGQSDGGSTALAAAYNEHYVDMGAPVEAEHEYAQRGDEIRARLPGGTRPLPWWPEATLN